MLWVRTIAIAGSLCFMILVISCTGGASDDLSLSSTQFGGDAPLLMFQDPGKKSSPGIEDASLNVTTSKVYYGTSVPKHVDLSPQQMLAIGTFGGCTGTLVTPRWVLTASHCSFLWGNPFCMGENPAYPNKCVGVKQWYDHSWADLSMVELVQDARDVLPEVQPIPLFEETLSEAWIGSIAEAAGYGLQEDGSTGVREFTAEPIVWFDQSTLSIDGEGKHGVCFGDSGGPVMVISSDGTTRVAGTLSNGALNCLGVDNYTRVDTFLDWITDLTGPLSPTPPAESPEIPEGSDPEEAPNEAPTLAKPINTPAENPNCGDLDFFGTCDGEVARWCDESVAMQADCAAAGQLCGVLTPELGYHCIPKECGTVDFLGICSGDTVQWCNRDGMLEELDCSQWDMACGIYSSGMGYYCVD